MARCYWVVSLVSPRMESCGFTEDAGRADLMHTLNFLLKQKSNMSEASASCLMFSTAYPSAWFFPLEWSSIERTGGLEAVCGWVWGLSITQSSCYSFVVNWGRVCFSLNTSDTMKGLELLTWLHKVHSKEINSNISFPAWQCFNQAKFVDLKGRREYLLYMGGQ